MRLNQEAKNLIAILALVLAITLALNMVISPLGNRDMWSWTFGLLAMAVVFWIWSRRESEVKRDMEAAGAANEAAQEAEELAKRTIVRHADSPAAAQSESDDLTRINGIGAVFETVLNEAGIQSYVDLAQSTVEALEAIFEAADRSRPGRLETWLAQAEFAAAGDWDGLKQYLDSLQD